MQSKTDLAIHWVELEFQGDGQRERIVFTCFEGVDGPCRMFYCSDPVLEVMVERGLTTLHNRDGHIVAPEHAGLSEWLQLLDWKHGPVTLIQGQLPDPEPDDEPDEGEGIWYVH